MAPSYSVPQIAPSYSVPSITPTYIPPTYDLPRIRHNNENIVCAVLSLLKELDDMELELIKRDIEKRMEF